MFAGGARGAAADTNGQSFESTALVSAAMPLLFAFYLAAVPAYGARPSLLFGFLFLIDVGLLAIAIARRQDLLHAVGAVATMLVMATWMSMRIGTWIVATHGASSQGLVAVGFTALFSVFYLVAPLVAGWFARPLHGRGRQGALRRAAPPGRVPGACGDRARVRRARGRSWAALLALSC